MLDNFFSLSAILVVISDDDIMWRRVMTLSENYRKQTFEQIILHVMEPLLSSTDSYL